MKTKPMIVCFLLFFSISGVANADLIIGGSTTGFYNSSLGTTLDGTNPYNATFLFPFSNSNPNDPLINPAPEPNLSSAQVFLGNWLTDPANLNGNWIGPQAIPFTWAVNTETAIVYAFSAGAGLENLVAKFGVDNGLFVWLDGTYISGALAPGTATMWEYTYSLPNLSAGTHYLQILLEDHGVATGYFVDVSGTPVPEPISMLLFGTGLVGIGKYFRRKLKK
jgi:hypothetical protein